MASTSEQRVGSQVVKTKKPATPNDKVKEEIQPRDLKIAWGSDDSQWKFQYPDENSSFAEAIKVMWFEVKAIYKGAKAGSTYKIGFTISLTSEAFGWENTPVYMMAKIGNSGSYTWKKLMINSKEVEKTFEFPSNFEIHIPISAKDTTLLFGLYEIWGSRWKGGLRIYNAYVTKV